MSRIEVIDLFGKDLNFKHKSNQKYKNTFGGIVSIIYIFISILIFSYFFNNYIQRKDIKIIYQPLKYETPPSTSLSKMNYSINFNLAIKKNILQYKNSIDELSTIFWIFGINYSNNDNSLLNITKCSQLTYVNHSSNNFDECLAVKFNQIETLNSDGLGIFIFVRNKTMLEENYPNYDLLIDIYMNDISFSLDNYTHPLQNLPRKHSLTIEYNSLITPKEIGNIFSYGITHVTTDYSWFFESNEETIEQLNLFNIADTKKLDFLIYPNYAYYLNVKLGNEGHSNKRSFQKFSEFLANASSVSNLIFLFFFILSTTYKNISIEIETLNNIFQQDSIRQKKESMINLEFNGDKEKKDTSDIVCGNSSNTSKVIMHKKVYNLRKAQKPLKNKINPETKVNDLRMVTIVLCACFRKNNKLYSDYLTGSSILNYYLNFDNYILKMTEHEYLKYLLLTREQLNLFKFVQLDYISKKQSNEFMTAITNLKDNSLVCNYVKQNNEDLKDNQFFLNIIKKSDLTETDKKILHSVGCDLNQSRLL